MILPPTTALERPIYDYTIALSGRSYRVRLAWGDRQACWRLDLYTARGVALLLGARLSTGALLTSRFPDPRFPRGYLVLVDTQGEGEEPTLASLGDRHKLLFLTPEEVALEG